MAVTIKVNDLTLTHKSSNGMSIATIPDVCLTPAPPAPPVPIPYPNIALSSDLVNGTTTVTADGGNMIAIEGSQFMKSTGDEPGVNGGVTCGVNMKETNWMTYSMDVFLDGKNACRLTDKQFHNHYNTVNMGGQLEIFLQEHPGMEDELRFLCAQICWCMENAERSARGKEYQGCLNKLVKWNQEYGNDPENLNPETPFNKDPATGQWSPGRPAPGSGGDLRTPDNIITQDPTQPISMDNIQAVVEVKFRYQNGHDCYSEDQQAADQEIADQANADVIVVQPYDCGCDDEPFDPDCEKKEQEQTQTQTQQEDQDNTLLWVLGAVAVVAVVALVVVTGGAVIAVMAAADASLATGALAASGELLVTAGTTEAAAAIPYAAAAGVAVTAGAVSQSGPNYCPSSGASQPAAVPGY